MATRDWNKNPPETFEEKMEMIGDYMKACGCTMVLLGLSFCLISFLLALIMG